jgi:thioredoxin-dependent peroxiredoxin
MEAAIAKIAYLKGGGLNIPQEITPRTESAMKLPIVIFFAISLLGLSAKAEPLAVGAKAPVITAKDQDGEPINFADIYAKGTTLIYFYPKAGTPGCTAQACSLRDSFADLKEKGLQIVGVSEDTAESQKKFKEENQLPFPLIADSNGQVAEAFGVPTTMGLAKRQSFIVKDGKIAWTSLQAKTKEHAQEVQAALTSVQ